MRASCLLLVAMLPATASFSLGVAPVTRRFVAASQSQPAAALRATVTPMMVEAKEEGEVPDRLTATRTWDPPICRSADPVFASLALPGQGQHDAAGEGRGGRRHHLVCLLGVGFLGRLCPRVHLWLP